MNGWNVPIKFCSASYRESLEHLVNHMALAEPQMQTVKYIAWLYGVPVRDVREHIALLWKNTRTNENEQKRHL